jgi:NADH-quinone oxidoreductase subunit A
MLESYIPIGIMALLVALATGAILLFSHLLGPKRMNPEKGYPYECGMPLLDTARKRVSVQFYLVALLFVLFDIETVFLVPYAVAAKNLGLEGFLGLDREFVKSCSHSGYPKLEIRNSKLGNLSLIQKKMPRPPLARLARLDGTEWVLAGESPTSAPGRPLSA